MPPYQGGGDMILSVTFEKTVYNKLPHKFEAGTPNMAGAVGLGGGDRLPRRAGPTTAWQPTKQEVLAYGTRVLSEVPGLRLIGTAHPKASVISFLLDGIHPHDIGTILDREGIAFAPGTTARSP